MHDYSALWETLSCDVKSSVLAAAEKRYPGHADFSNLSALFEDWAFVFVKARYYFELYENYTAEQARELAELWISLGAPEHEAKVRYHPLELQALIEALVAHIEKDCRT